MSYYLSRLYIIVQFLFLFFLIIMNSTFLTGVKLLELYTDSSAELNTGSKIIFMFVDNFTLQKNCFDNSHVIINALELSLIHI